MNELTWAQGLMLWIVLGLGAAWAVGEIARAQPKDRDHDWLADRKRKIEQRAARTRMGVER